MKAINGDVPVLRMLEKAVMELGQPRLEVKFVVLVEL